MRRQRVGGGLAAHAARNRRGKSGAKADYKTAVEALAPISQEYFTAKYADIPEMYQEACYQYANALYADKQPFEALKYYRLIPDYKDVTSKRLKRTVYEIMGTWETSKGVRMEFREDGTCAIDGREYYYSASVYALNLGDRPEELSLAYSIVSNSEKKLTLQHVKQKTYYRMTRVTE